MPETIIPKQTRFVTIKEYCKRSGLSYATVDHMCKSGQLNYITTEAGLRRIDTKEPSADNDVVLDKLAKTEKMLSALCKQFNTTVV